MSRNQLDQETSPYLLLHKDNPVHWYPWGREALAESEATGKPILLSIGYTACHWCHVMNHESFADAETAAVMNDNFINVKVDREERPDLDQLYQAAANIMGNQGGWPLTMFLTPKGVPFFAGTYFPKEPRFGQPPFKTVLNDVAKLYREQPDPVATAAARLTEQLNNLWNRDMRGNLDAQHARHGVAARGQRFDIFFGGLTGQQKFPSVPLVEMMWRAYLRTGAQQYLQVASITLDHMLLGGLYDHVGGGFFRYTTDERWLVPHFEKMLNDNAQLIELMLLIWQHNRNAICQSRIEETIGWLLREMMVRGRVRRQPRCRFRRRGGQILSLERAGDRRRPDGHLRAEIQDGLWRHARRQFPGPQHSAAHRHRRTVPAAGSGRGAVRRASANCCWRRV